MSNIFVTLLDDIKSKIVGKKSDTVETVREGVSTESLTIEASDSKEFVTEKITTSVAENNKIKSGKTTVKEDESNNDVSDAEAAKKKKSMIIRGVVIVFLLYFAVDTVLEEEEAEEGPVNVVAKKAKTSPVKKAKAKVKTKAKIDRKKVEKVTRPKIIATREVIPEPVVKKRSVVQERKQEERVEIAVEKEVVSEELDLSFLDDDDDGAVDKKQESESQSLDFDSLFADKKEKPKKAKKASPKVGEVARKSTPVTGFEALFEEKESDKELKTIINKFGETLTEHAFIRPRTYEYIGRGLVYNCADKHWACVDRSTYFACKGNYDWSKQEGRKAACAALNVYASIDDCRTVQIDNIHNVVSDNFCYMK